MRQFKSWLTKEPYNWKQEDVDILVGNIQKSIDEDIFRRMEDHKASLLKYMEECCRSYIDTFVTYENYDQRLLCGIDNHNKSMENIAIRERLNEWMEVGIGYVNGVYTPYISHVVDKRKL